MKAVIIVFDDNGNLMTSNTITPTVETIVTSDQTVEEYTFTYQIKKLKRDNNRSSGLKIERSFIDENAFR